MFPASVRTAFHLKKAIELAAKRLKPIGVCETKQDLFKAEYEPEKMDDEHDNGGGEQKSSAQNKALLKELAAIYRNDGRDYSSGVLDAPFILTITRPGCEFSGEILSRSDEGSRGTNSKDGTPSPDATSQDPVTERLKKWFENGAVSGFGDVRAQETKVNANVRDAREIPASEFSVSPNLIEQIQKCWGDYFVPSSVRVEPYKIHMYGPGGQFKAHKDTPERNLVGTFLVGLGDTTRKGCLFIGNQVYDSYRNSGHKATSGSWIAFHPDTKHAVAQVKDGYRAVIAFKLFRKEIEEVKQTSVIHKKMEKVLERMQAPFGLLLAHEYCMGTTVLSGLDNILNEAAQAIALTKNVNVHFLPVLTKFNAQASSGDTVDIDEFDVDAKVYPFTQTHVDALLEVKQKASSESDPSSDEDEDRQGSRMDPDKTEWLVNAFDIPFYSIDFDKTAVTWSRFEDEGAEYTGNESRPYTEDSIYFSYGMVVLPDVRGQKRARDEDGNSGIAGPSKKRV
ncbi:hypothetical protein SCP_0601360 [Sparassis crispa]|uniref:Fe2OG dioxygenase domain-containing protein n=1 Tax=Sparassis crispa TaxID=139825 RepID=A0A401GPL4_9APHY|nr:hypothetical protein SCP_0601360 [Sparassis crispa]GBE84158.1 hypothetical protein SCP_0601360 [Sparassis crispa]